MWHLKQVELLLINTSIILPCGVLFKPYVAAIYTELSQLNIVNKAITIGIYTITYGYL